MCGIREIRYLFRNHLLRANRRQHICRQLFRSHIFQRGATHRAKIFCIQAFQQTTQMKCMPAFRFSRIRISKTQLLVQTYRARVLLLRSGGVSRHRFAKYFMNITFSRSRVTVIGNFAPGSLFSLAYYFRTYLTFHFGCLWSFS